MKPTFITLLALCLWLPVVGAEKVKPLTAEEYWPGWLGPKRNGWVNNFQPPKKRPEKLQQMWLGAGYRSPIVAGGQRLPVCYSG